MVETIDFKKMKRSPNQIRRMTGLPPSLSTVSLASDPDYTEVDDRGCMEDYGATRSCLEILVGGSRQPHYAPTIRKSRFVIVARPTNKTARISAHSRGNPARFEFAR
jgi:hypothetical protein